MDSFQSQLCVVVVVDQTNQLDPLKGPDPTCEPEAPGPGTS